MELFTIFLLYEIIFGAIIIHWQLFLRKLIKGERISKYIYFIFPVMVLLNFCGFVMFIEIDIIYFFIALSILFFYLILSIIIRFKTIDRIKQI
jgi:hypothetical protein